MGSSNSRKKLCYVIVEVILAQSGKYTKIILISSLFIHKQDIVFIFVVTNTSKIVCTKVGFCPIK